MRATLGLFILAACASPPKLSDAERAALDELRRVAQQCDHAADNVMLEYQRGIDYRTTAAHHKHRVETPWATMRAHVEAVHFADPDLDRRVRRYLELRTNAWREVGQALSGFEDEAPHIFKYRELAASAAAERVFLDEAIAKYNFRPLPPLAPDPVVQFPVPSDPAPPGPAYLRAGGEVVLVDDTGFHAIAHDVEWIGARPDGQLWMCGHFFVARWDGKSLVTTKAKHDPDACAVGPDGKLWTFTDDVWDKGQDVLSSFDGTRWTAVTKSMGDPYLDGGQLVIDRDGRIYADVGPEANAGFDGYVFTFENGAWRQIERKLKSMPVHDVEELVRGEDGNVWIVQQITANEHQIPDSLSKLTPTGTEEPVFIDDYFQTSFFAVHVDAHGTPTLLDLQRDVVIQGKQELVLPAPAMRYTWERDHANQFDIDGAGRIWIDLADGLHVIDHAKHTIYPHGSIDGIREDLAQVIVIGAGPKLPAPAKPAGRTITGITVANTDLVLCSREGGGLPCAPALPHWETTSDAEGRFTFQDIPRYRFGISAHVGERNAKRWKTMSTHCCADETELGKLGFPVVVE